MRDKSDHRVSNQAEVDQTVTESETGPMMDTDENVHIQKSAQEYYGDYAIKSKKNLDQKSSSKRPKVASKSIDTAPSACDRGKPVTV